MRVRGSARLGPLAVALALMPGCGKSSETSTDAAVDPAATVSAVPGASSSGRPETAPLPPARPKGPSASVSAPPEPIHPLAVWMRGPATQALDSGDLETIARAFEQMASWAPPGYANWASIAKDGSQAARAGSIEGVRAACRGCHTQYEAEYRSTLSTRPLT